MASSSAANASPSERPDALDLHQAEPALLSGDPQVTGEHELHPAAHDLVNNFFPLPLLAELHKDMTDRIAQLDDALLRSLRAAGFQLDFGDDGSGFLMKYHRTGGGYYINVGCSDLIVAGKIKVKQDAEIAGLDGALHRRDHDGHRHDRRGHGIPEHVRVGARAVRRRRGGPGRAVWGLDEEGEVRALWRRTGQPGLWIVGGNLQQCRPYSKYLALQIKGSREGLVPLAAGRLATARTAADRPAGGLPAAGRPGE
jgi:hypothetical protein